MTIIVVGVTALVGMGALSAAPSDSLNSFYTSSWGQAERARSVSKLPSGKASGVNATIQRASWRPRQRITVAMLGDPSGLPGNNMHDKNPQKMRPVADTRAAGAVLRIPEALIALIFGVLGFLVVGRRDLS